MNANGERQMSIKVTFEGAESEEGEQVYNLPEQLNEFVEQIRLYATHNCDFYVNGKSYSGEPD